MYECLFLNFYNFCISNYFTLKTNLKNYFLFFLTNILTFFTNLFFNSLFFKHFSYDHIPFDFNFTSTPLSVFSISTKDSNKLKAKTEVNGVETFSLFDTCAEVNIITLSFAKSLNHLITPSSDSIISFDNTS